MDAITDGFLNKIIQFDVFVRCKMSFLIPDVFLPLDDPTYNDILMADNYGPSEDPPSVVDAGYVFPSGAR